MNVNLADIEKAISVLYYDDNPANRTQAHGFLLTISDTKEGWELAKYLLNKEKSVEIQFFASTLMAKKTKQGWEQLNTEEKQAFCQYVLNEAISYASSAKQVREKLVSTTAATLIRVFSFWPTSLVELFSLFNAHQQNSKQHVMIRIVILSIISRLPEELEAYKANFSVLKEAKEVLLRSLADIIALTDLILQQPAQAWECQAEMFELKKLSITCCLNWTNIELNFVHLVRSPIFGILFNCLADNDPYAELFEVASELLTDVLTRRPTTVTTTPTFVSALKIAKKSLLQSSDDGVIFEVFKNVLATKAIFDTSGNDERINAIALLVSGVIENNCFFFYAQNNNSVFLELKMALLSYLITITAHNTDQVSELSLNSWSSFTKHWAYMNETEMRPVFEALLGVLWKKSIYPIAVVQADSSEFHGFQTYRAALARCLADIFVTMPHAFIQVLGTKIQEVKGASSWKDMEALLFCLISGLARVTEVDLNNFNMAEIVFHFLSQSLEGYNQWQNVAPFVQSVIAVIGKCAPWLPDNLLPYCFEILLPNLACLQPALAQHPQQQQQDVAIQAAISLSAVCRYCHRSMLPLLQTIVGGIIEKYQSISTRNRIIVLSAISHSLYTLLALENEQKSVDYVALLQRLLEPICGRIVNEAMKVAESELYCLAALTHSDCLIDSNIVDLGMFCSETELITPQPFSEARAGMMLALWPSVLPILTMVQSKYPNELVLIEGVALVMHAFVLNLTPAYLASHPETTVMVDGLKLLVSGYMARPSAAALTVVKKIIDSSLFVDDRLKEVLVALFEVTFQLFLSTQCPNDIVIAFFDLVSSVLTSLTAFFVASGSSEVLKSLLKSAIHCLLLSKDLEVQKSIMGMIEQMISINNNADFQRYVLEAYTDVSIGYHLVSLVMNGLISTNCNFRITELLTSLLFKLIRIDNLREGSSYYLGEIINQPEFLSVRNGDELVFSAESKSAVYQILLNIPNIRKLKMFLQDLSGIMNGTQTVDILLSYLM